MGSVSQRLLVLLTLMPRASISLHAFSIQPMRSPRLLPRAMYAVRFILVELDFSAVFGFDGKVYCLKGKESWRWWLETEKNFPFTPVDAGGDLTVVTERVHKKRLKLRFEDQLLFTAMAFMVDEIPE